MQQEFAKIAQIIVNIVLEWLVMNATSVMIMLFGLDQAAALAIHHVKPALDLQTLNVLLVL